MARKQNILKNKVFLILAVIIIALVALQYITPQLKNIRI